jgi:para-aminobenzoate synthetase/4-amino-4-deoxychorismate lyase
MIVDLLRNDLSRVATPGTVEVPQLFSVETYPTIHTMTSTVTARLDSGCSAIDLPGCNFSLRLDHWRPQDPGDGNHR